MKEAVEYAINIVINNNAKLRKNVQSLLFKLVEHFPNLESL
jgi:hypothetical protein